MKIRRFPFHCFLCFLSLVHLKSPLVNPGTFSPQLAGTAAISRQQSPRSTAPTKLLQNHLHSQGVGLVHSMIFHGRILVKNFERGTSLCIIRLYFVGHIHSKLPLWAVGRSSSPGRPCVGSLCRTKAGARKRSCAKPPKIWSSRKNCHFLGGRCWGSWTQKKTKFGCSEIELE